jgi:hypothetical protein
VPTGECSTHTHTVRQDDFELLTQLGSGFTSVVYAARVRRARTLAPGKDDIVVLKVMPKRRAVELGVEQLTVQERANLELIQGSRFILHLVRYGDEKVANRGIRAWHGATEKGP